MGFTVTRPSGTKDSELVEYARLLRQTGNELGNLPRVPDPVEPTRRWVRVWDTEEEARAFAHELEKRTGDNGWSVTSTDDPPSNGPFGPLLVQLLRSGDGLTVALHPLSVALIQEAFPDERPGIRRAFMDTQTWDEFREKQGTLTDLVEEVLPAITGLTSEQLQELGYAVLDADNERTWVYVPPAGAKAISS